MQRRLNQPHGGSIIGSSRMGVCSRHRYLILGAVILLLIVGLISVGQRVPGVDTLNPATGGDDNHHQHPPIDGDGDGDVHVGDGLTSFNNNGNHQKDGGDDDGHNQVSGGSSQYANTSVVVIDVLADVATACKHHRGGGVTRPKKSAQSSSMMMRGVVAAMEAMCLLREGDAVFKGGLHADLPLSHPVLYNKRRHHHPDTTISVKSQQEQQLQKPTKPISSSQSPLIRGGSIVDDGGVDGMTGVVVSKDWANAPMSTMWVLREGVRGGPLGISPKDGTLHEREGGGVGATSHIIPYHGPPAVQEDYFHRLDMPLDFPQLPPPLLPSSTTTTSASADASVAVISEETTTQHQEQLQDGGGGGGGGADIVIEAADAVVRDDNLLPTTSPTSPSLPPFNGNYFANTYDRSVYPNGPGGLRLWYDAPLASYFYQPFSRWRSNPGRERIVFGRSVNITTTTTTTTTTTSRMDDDDIRTSNHRTHREGIPPQGVPPIPDYITLDCRGGGNGVGGGTTTAERVYAKVASELDILSGSPPPPAASDASSSSSSDLMSKMKSIHSSPIDEGVLSTLLGRTRISAIIHAPLTCLSPTTPYSAYYPPRTLQDWRAWIGEEAPAWRVVKVWTTTYSSSDATSGGDDVIVTSIALRRRVKAFHFGIAGGTDNRAALAEYTWGQRTPLLWFADVDVGALRPIISPSKHPMYVQNKFNFLTYRIARIWEMVYQHYQCSSGGDGGGLLLGGIINKDPSGGDEDGSPPPQSPKSSPSSSCTTHNTQYDWYIRLWDDNYYNEEGLYNILGRLRPQEHSLMLGKNTWRNLGTGSSGKRKEDGAGGGGGVAAEAQARIDRYFRTTSKERRQGGVFPFTGGGAGWFLSSAGMRAIGPSFATSSSTPPSSSSSSSPINSGGYDWLGEMNKRTDLYIKHALHNEDVFLTAWFYILNVTILNMPGVEHISPGLGPRQRCMREELLWQLRWGRYPQLARRSLLVPSISDTLPPSREAFCRHNEEDHTNKKEGGGDEVSSSNSGFKRVMMGMPAVPRTPRMSPDEATIDVQLTTSIVNYFTGSNKKRGGPTVVAGTDAATTTSHHHHQTGHASPPPPTGGEGNNASDAFAVVCIVNNTTAPTTTQGNITTTTTIPFTSPLQLFYEYTSSDPLLLMEDAHYSASTPIVWHYMSPYRLIRMEILLYGGGGDSYFPSTTKSTSTSNNNAAPSTPKRKWRREHDFEVRGVGGSNKWVMMSGVPVTNSDKKVPVAKRRPCYKGTPYKRVQVGGGGASSSSSSKDGTTTTAISIQSTVTGKKVKSVDWVSEYLLPPQPPRSGGPSTTLSNQSTTTNGRPAVPMEEYYFYQPEEGISIFEYPLADPPIEVGVM